MEALEFLKEYKRMCSSYKYCNDCPLVGANCLSLGVRKKSYSNFLIITNEVAQWSKEHPIITNARKFEEVFGLFGHRLIDQSAQWWDEPYKEPEHED